MPTREQENISGGGTHPVDDLICSQSHLFWGFTIRTSVKEQPPLRVLGMNFQTAHTLVLAVIPFQEIAVDLRNASKPSQFTGTLGALQRAAKHLIERQSFESLA